MVWKGEKNPALNGVSLPLPKIKLIGSTILTRIRVRRKPKGGELPSPLRETLPHSEGNRSLRAEGMTPSEQGDRLTLLGVNTVFQRLLYAFASHG